MDYYPKYVLPEEIVRKILSKCDIDTRRKLGIFTKLSVPMAVCDKLRSIPKPNVSMMDNVFVNLGSLGEMTINVEGALFTFPAIKHKYTITLSKIYSPHQTHVPVMIVERDNNGHIRTIYTSYDYFIIDIPGWHTDLDMTNHVFHQISMSMYI